MILAFDTYYYENEAKTVALLFRSWGDAEAVEVYEEVIYDIPEYESGSFYKRELPCILSLLKQIDLAQIKYIIVDGYVVLDDEGNFGLGGYLFESLERKIAIIGVAKSNFAKLDRMKMDVLRGQSAKPLYVTSIGIELPLASQYIEQMHGEYRMPTLLKKLDQHTRVGMGKEEME